MAKTRASKGNPPRSRENSRKSLSTVLPRAVIPELWIQKQHMWVEALKWGMICLPEVVSSQCTLFVYDIHIAVTTTRNGSSLPYKIISQPWLTPSGPLWWCNSDSSAHGCTFTWTDWSASCHPAELDTLLSWTFFWKLVRENDLISISILVTQYCWLYPALSSLCSWQV